MNTPSSHRDRTLGLWLGVLGVAIFAVTLPATRLATGTSEQPQLSPWFVTVGRAALAGLLSAVFLLATRSPRPQPQQWRHLGWAVLGNALGYPLLLAFALRSVTASHAAVVTALLPLVTAAVAALVLHQRARLGFWLFAVLGSLLVVAFSLLRGWQQGHGLFSLEAADALLVGAVVAASVGYIHGARITPALGAERVICWVCLMALPVSLPATLWLWPSHPVAPSAWGGFLYVGVFSMGRLLRLVPGAGPGRRPAREPDAAAAALSFHPGRRPAAGRVARPGHPGLCRRRCRHRGGGQAVFLTWPRYHCIQHLPGDQ